MAKFVSKEDDNYVLVNKNDGSLKKYVHRFKVTTDQFIMIYLHSIPNMMKLEGSHMKFLMCCWYYSDYSLNRPEGNTFTNNDDFKKYIQNEMGLELSNSSINAILSRLTAKGFLVRRSKGSYMLNPKYFFKGTITNRSKLIVQFENDDVIKPNDGFDFLS